jgi:hypothetical protein
MPKYLEQIIKEMGVLEKDGHGREDSLTKGRTRLWTERRKHSPLKALHEAWVRGGVWSPGEPRA